MILFIQNIIFLYLSIEDILYNEISYIILCLYFLLEIYNNFYIGVILSIINIIICFIPQNPYIGNGDIAFIILYIYNQYNLMYLYIFSLIFINRKYIPLIPILYLSFIISTIQ